MRKVIREGCLAVLVLVIGLAVLFNVLHVKSDMEQSADGDQITTKAETSEDEKKTSEPGETYSFTFAGVGDNLVHEAIYYYYPSRDYTPMYAPVKEIIESADLGYVNLETVSAGDAYGLSGYPSFNSPAEFIDALTSSGFDWFSTSSNHSMDAGADGLISEMEHLSSNGAVYTGTHVSAEAAGSPVVAEVNGLKVGLAGFTYGLNGYVKPEGMDWLIDVFLNDDGSVNYDIIDERLDALQDVSDVQIVAMHWGDEYHTTPNETQAAVAEYLNSKGVEVIIGSHPHVIEPVEILHGEQQDTLVYYSLGNFLSAQDENDRMVGGLASFTLNYDSGTDTTWFTDVKFIPTVMWIRSDLGDYAVYTIDQWTDELAASHWLADQDMSKATLSNYVAEVMGSPDGIEIVLG